jgi:CRISPR-associated protein Cas1
VHLLQKQLENIQTAYDLNSILGIEGTASKIFFNFWFKGIPWYGRKPRAKTDFLNTTLDIGYTFLFSYIEALLNLYGFDIYQGVYHRNFYQRKSLVCDIIEPFRCIIDKAVRNALGLRQLKADDFVVRQDKWYLKNEKNKEYARWLMESILEHKEEIFLYVQKYYRCFMRQKAISEYPVFKIKNEEA